MSMAKSKREGLEFTKTGRELLNCLIVLMHKNAFFAISIDLKAKGKKLNEKRILRSCCTIQNCYVLKESQTLRN